MEEDLTVLIDYEQYMNKLRSDRVRRDADDIDGVTRHTRQAQILAIYPIRPPINGPIQPGFPVNPSYQVNGSVAGEYSVPPNYPYNNHQNRIHNHETEIEIDIGPCADNDNCDHSHHSHPRPPSPSFTTTPTPHEHHHHHHTGPTTICADPVNEVYQKCGNKCVLGCRYAATSVGISFAKHDCDRNDCVEGCFCKTGLVRHQTKCIPPSECPIRKCLKNEIYVSAFRW